MNRKILKYARENFGGVLHTTLNPDGPGVVRIHLVPPKFNDKEIGAGVAIINGQDIIPINTGWMILLAEFIKQVNRYSGRAITDGDAEEIMKQTVKGMKRLFPFVGEKVFREDVYRIMDTFTKVARGKEPTENIGYISLGEYAPMMRAPHRMDLMISSMEKDGHWHCNQKCVHCYAAGQTQAVEQELSTENWKKILDKLKEACIPQVTFTGGEPTMRKDLVELVEHAAWFVTRLNTNGIALTEELCQKLMDASLDSLQITFYSSDEEIHNRLVGANRYKETVKGIENALAAGLSVSINTPLCTLNRDYVKTLEFLHDKGIIYVTCSGLITTGSALSQESESLQLTEEEIKVVLKDAVEYCYSHDMEINFTSPGWVEDSFCEELGITTPSCGACLSNMAVTPGGNVVPCQSWLSGALLGNLLTTDWEKIWENPECVKRRKFSAGTIGICPLRKLPEGKAKVEEINEQDADKKSETELKSEASGTKAVEGGKTHEEK